MEISVDVKLKFKTDNSGWHLGDELYALIKYKLPYNKLKTKSRVTLCFQHWDKYEKSYEMFQEDVLSHIEENELMVRKVANAVTKKINADSHNAKTNNKEEEIIKLLKNKSKFNVIVKVEEE